MSMNYIRRTMKGNIILYVFSLLLVTTAYSCDSDDEKGPDFTVTLSHSKGASGDAISINGRNFAADNDSPQVYFGTASASINNIGNTSLEVKVPPGNEGDVVDVYVQSAGKYSNRIPFTYIKHQPSLTEISAGSGVSGDEMQVYGTGFGRNVDAVSVIVGDKPAEITEFTSTYIKFRLPDAEGTIETEIYISVAGVPSGKISFRYTDHLPRISSLGEHKGLHWETLLINGSGFNTALDGNQVLFDNVEADIISVTEERIEVEVPYIYKNQVVLRVLNRDYPNEYSNEQKFYYNINACDSIAIVGAEWTVDKSIREDIVLRHGNMVAFDSKQQISYIEIPLGDDIELGMEYQSPSGLTKTTTMCKRVGAFAGINASYFSTWGAHDYFRVDGVERTPPSGWRNSPGYVNGCVVLNGTRDLSFVKVPNGSPGGSSVPGEKVMMVGPMLRHNSVTQSITSVAHNTDRHPRSGIGVTRDDKLIFIVVDGRASGLAAGVTNDQFALIMRFLDATDALNLDGGGSSTLFVNGYGSDGIVNRPSDGSERSVANVIYAKFK